MTEKEIEIAEYIDKYNTINSPDNWANTLKKQYTGSELSAKLKEYGNIYTHWKIGARFIR